VEEWNVPATHFRTQADWARKLDSPLYAHLLAQSATDYEQGGPLRDLIEPHQSEPAQLALPLRLMGAVHRLVLEGRAPALAPYYPSVGGIIDLDAAWQAFREFVASQREAIETLMPNPVQTNDAARSASLLGGFLLVAGLTGLPLRLLEVGSSAGLNLCWDRYRYAWPGGGWGDAASTLLIEDVFAEGMPPIPTAVTVASRAGCDPNPVDVRTPEGRLSLLSFTWPDHVERIRRLDTAIAIARSTTYGVEQARAVEWVESKLAQAVPEAATVVYHSVVWPYLSEDERQQLTAVIDNAGARATAAAPLAWLRMEPGAKEADLSLRIYPGLADRVIATCGFHTPAVRWLG
jgi:hypothetical protein